MGEIQRWSRVYLDQQDPKPDSPTTMKMDPQGTWVHFSDYTTKDAEAKRLKETIRSQAETIEVLYGVVAKHFGLPRHTSPGSPPKP